MSAETVGDVAARSSDAGRGGLAATRLCPAKGRASTYALTNADRSNMAGIQYLPTLFIGGRRYKYYNHMNSEATGAVSAVAQLGTVLH
jgi:hypothetical protein